MMLKHFDFIKHRNIFFTISIVLTLLGILSLFIFKLNLSIDFTSGTRIDVTANKALPLTKVEQTMSDLGYQTEQTVQSGQNNQVTTIRLNKELNRTQSASISDRLKQDFGNVDVSMSTVSPQVGRDLAKKALYAVIIASLFIIAYVWIRFEFLQGLTAVIALIHDAFFIITVFSLLHIEVNILFISAVLTIIGYSINDTIVTFDRVRENIKLSKKRLSTLEDFGHIVNQSIHQTITRSINTVLTVLFPVITLLIFGSESIRTFTIALFVGLLCGVYSSIFIACPLWAVLKVKHLAKRKKKRTIQPQS